MESQPQPQSGRPMGEDYRQEWQTYYAENPYAETDREQDTSIEEYTTAMIGVFDELGIIDEMRQRSLVMVASSVSTGEKDAAFLSALDKDLGQGAPQSHVLMTDYAVSEGPKPVVKQPQQAFGHIMVQSIVSDAYRMPVAAGTVDVLYERMGALYHAADEDKEYGHGGELVGQMLAEYRRILKPDGRIIVDWDNSKVPVSTALEMEKTAPLPLEHYLQEQGFVVSYAGGDEGFLVLSKRLPHKAS